MIKKITLSIILINMIFITGCTKKNNINEKEPNENNIVYNEYEIYVKDSITNEGIIINELIHLDENEKLQHTNFKFVLKHETKPFTYIVNCNKFDENYNFCNSSIQTLIIDNKEIKINENKYGPEYFPYIEEKFLTYIKVLNDSYLLVLVNSDGYYINGTLYIYDFKSKKVFEEKNIAENYYVPPTNTSQEINKLNLFPTIEENKLIYYTCDKNKKIVYKYNLSLDTFNKTLLETVENAYCHLDNLKELEQ